MRRNDATLVLIQRCFKVVCMTSLSESPCLIEPQHEIPNNVVCATSKGSDQPVHTRSLIRAFACRLNIL